MAEQKEPEPAKRDRRMTITGDARVPLWAVGSAFLLGIYVTLYFNGKFAALSEQNAHLEAKVDALGEKVVYVQQAQDWLDQMRAANPATLRVPPLPKRAQADAPPIAVASLPR